MIAKIIFLVAFVHLHFMVVANLFPAKRPGFFSGLGLIKEQVLLIGALLAMSIVARLIFD